MVSDGSGSHTQPGWRGRRSAERAGLRAEARGAAGRRATGGLRAGGSWGARPGGGSACRLYCPLSARRRAEGGRGPGGGWGPGRPLRRAEPSPPFCPWRARQSLSFLPTIRPPSLSGRRSPPGVSQVWTTDGTQKGRRAWPGLHFSCPACPRASPGGPEACCPGRLSEHSCSLLGGGCGRRVDGKARGQQRDRPSGRGDGTCLFHSQQPSAFSSKSTTGPRVWTAAGKPALRRPSQDPQQSPWPPRTREAPASGDDRDTGRPCHWALGGRLALREALRPAPGAPPDAKLGVRLHLARPDTARLPRPRPVHLNLQQEKQGPGGALLFCSRTADLWASEPRGALRLQS